MNIKAYLNSIETDLKRGIATEYTHRSSLETLLESFQAGINASNDPKHIACGAPDFIVERKKIPLGYVETKDVGVDLDKVVKSEQMKRYLAALHNLILTDYLEFRWYVDGKERMRVVAAEVGKNKHLVTRPERVDELETLLQGFFETEVPILLTPKDLAERLAHLAHLMRDLILNELQSEDGPKGALHKQYQTFQELLLPNLTHGEFADLYAQTMAYGLFAARISMPDGKAFSRISAYQYLGENRFLRRLFMDVGEELDDSIISDLLDDIASLLSKADFSAILQDFGKRTRTEDPIVHFYETFLAAYDPKMRESRGVYYTPEPVVQFIVNSVDWVLREKFGKPLGLADPDVNILDPASGTGTFLYFVLRLVHERMVQRGQAGQWQDYVHNYLLSRLYGFELLMAPYVMSHLKLGLQLKDELGYQWQKDDRLKVYLTNSLDEGVTKSEMLEGLGHYITDEANAAAVVKKQTPIMVVLGNPPYSGHSANSSKDANGNLNFIGKLLKDYYFINGVPLGEKNPKWLQDDYVKFIRFAQWRIEQTGYGVLAFITNHSYLDNPTFRGMRKSLMDTFTEIFIIDLHGNTMKKEQTIDGGKDENVFDIQQGVAIFLGIKSFSVEKVIDISSKKDVKIHLANFLGTREEKYSSLLNGSLLSQQYDEIMPNKPFYLFTIQNENSRKEYEEGWKITDILKVNSVGIVTGQDEKVISYTKNEADASSNQLGIDKNIIEKILYRPFDKRYILYDKSLVTRPRVEVMKNMLKRDNFGLIYMRQVALSDHYSHFGVSDLIVDNRSFYSNKGIMSFSPLYIYNSSNESQGSLFAQLEPTRQPNIAAGFIQELSQRLCLSFIGDGQGDMVTNYGPEDVFYYIYAVFHAPTYRSRYAEFLKIDFPRVPLTSNLPLFRTLVGLGKELVDLHLLRSKKVENFITSYPVSGSHLVEKVQYAGGNVWINPLQYFGGVPQNVWEFKVGGYQVCEKWLKDRKGRNLSGDDINHYQRVVVALQETIRLMGEIDAAIPNWPME